MLIRRASATPASRRLRIGARAIGCVATILMVIVGCTTVTDGAPTVDTAIAPAYRTSVSASISASAATSSMRESRRQQSLTTRAIYSACEALVTSSKDAIEKMNVFVGAFNQRGDTVTTEGPAIDALNHTADVVAGSLSNALAAELRDALNAYVDASRAVANAIATHVGAAEFNRRLDQLNDTMIEARRRCRASI